MSSAVGPLSPRVAALEKILLSNGKPSLEDRLRDYIDARDKHKERNCEESIQGLADCLKDETKERKEQHGSNDLRFRNIERILYIGFGIMTALQAVGYVLIQGAKGR